jgi:RNA polymerase sigma-70 factor (ECF subfamily)
VATPPGLDSEAERRGRREYDGLSDQELACQLRERVPEAHAFVYRECARVVRLASYRVLRSHDHVDDAVQRVFEELWIHPERFDPTRGSIDHYLAMQGRSRSIDLLRSEISRARRETDDEASRAFVARSLDEGNEMQQLLDSLPLGEREVIQLAYFGELTYREVALKLDLPPGTVKSRIRKGLLHLRTVIANATEGDALPLPAVSTKNGKGGVRPPSAGY